MDRLVKELNKEEDRKHLRDEMKQDALRVLMILAAALVAVMIWVSVRRTMEIQEVQAATWESVGTYKLTWYCPCRSCSGKWGHQTSSGATCEEGVTVACANLPAGTRVLIEGIGERIVQDTGAGVRGKHLDIFMESHQECLKNGIQYRRVWVLK